MPALIYDPSLERKVQAERQDSEACKHDEVWDGVYVYMPLANNEHQQLASRFTGVLQAVFNWSIPPDILAGTNVSDRIEDWTLNFREPDVAAFLEGTSAVNCGTHWCGGPDFLVEVISAGDPSREKMPFYASINCREALIIDRDPWQLELRQLQNGKMVEVGKSTLAQPNLLASSVMPVTFRLIPGTTRPQIEIVHTATGQTWLV